MTNFRNIFQINRVIFFRYLFLFLFSSGFHFQVSAQWPGADSIKSKLYVKEGVASYYANRFHGRITTNGERYNKNKYTAAHRTLKFGTLVKVTNLRNKKWVIVRINDRGPFVGKRIIDLSYKAAKHLGMVNGKGLARVRVEEIPKEKVKAKVKHKKTKGKQKHKAKPKRVIRHAETLADK